MNDRTRQVVITGGTGSLGRAIAAAFESAAWSVAAPGHRELDVRDEAAVRRFFHHRPVDLLVCAAGIIRDAPLLRTAESTWDEIWEVNFTGAARCAVAAMPGMLAQQAGHIIFIASHSALHPPAGQAAYAAAKAALLGLTGDLATRHGPSNIRINAVLPGFLETPMTEAVTRRRRAEILAAHSLARFNTCRETAAFIAFLHHHLPHTSGQAFQLDSRANPPGGF